MLYQIFYVQTRQMILITRLAVAYNLKSKLSLFLAVFGLCSGVFDTIWALLADEAEFWFYIIWLMKTIDNVPYFLSPKSTVHSSTTAKFSTRIRLNLVGFQTFARRARTRVHCKTKFSMRGSGDGQSPDRHRIFRGYVHGHAFWQLPDFQTSR